MTSQQRKREWKKNERRRNHIDQYTNARSAQNPGTFISQERMREIRWEEAMANRRLKEKGLSKDDHQLMHSNCSCGSEGCLGVPWYMKKEADAD